MFVWSSSASPVSEGGGGLHVFGSNEFGASEQSGRSDHGAKEIRMLVSDHPQNGENKGILFIYSRLPKYTRALLLPNHLTISQLY